MKKNLNLEEKELLFLSSCGFYAKWGFWQEDVDTYKAKYPHKYYYFVVCGETKPIKEIIDR